MYAVLKSPFPVKMIQFLDGGGIPNYEVSGYLFSFLYII